MVKPEQKFFAGILTISSVVAVLFNFGIYPRSIDNNFLAIGYSFMIITGYTVLFILSFIITGISIYIIGEIAIYLCKTIIRWLS
jgi:hypothetical protein